MCRAPAKLISWFLGYARLLPLNTLALLAGTRPPHFHDVFRLVIQSTAQMSSAQKGLSLSPCVKLSSPLTEWTHCVSPMDLSQSETFWLVVCVLIPICLLRPGSELHESRNLFYFAIPRTPQLSCSLYSFRMNVQKSVQKVSFIPWKERVAFSQSKR